MLSGDDDTMRNQPIQLQSPDGSHHRWVTQGEINRMIIREEVTRVSKRREKAQRFRLIEVPEPSDSKETPTVVTLSDSMAVVGLHRVNDVWLERLIGFGLIPEGTPLPASGYLA